jgi:transposase-like protein
MAAPRRYPDELRERANRKAVDARQDPATRAGALARIAEQLDINPETLRNWVTQAEIDGGGRSTSSPGSSRFRSRRPGDSTAAVQSVPARPTAAIIHQSCWSACRGEVQRVAHYEQPVFAWR